MVKQVATIAVTLTMDKRLYDSIDNSKTGKGELRNTVEKEILYRLQHSMELGDVQRSFQVVLRDAPDRTLTLEVGDEELAKMYYRELRATPEVPERSYWSVRLNRETTSPEGPREGLALIRADLPRMMLQWVMDETRDENPYAVEEAVKISTFFQEALQNYETLRLDRQPDGLEYIQHLSVPY